MICDRCHRPVKLGAAYMLPKITLDKDRRPIQACLCPDCHRAPEPEPISTEPEPDELTYNGV